MAKKKSKVEEPVESVAEAVEEQIKKSEMVIGRVFNCEKLNVREKPDKTAGVVCVIAKNTEVEIVDESSLNTKFYKVCLPSGIQGYCMKEFLAKV